MNKEAAVRYRIKNTGIYVDPLPGSSGQRISGWQAQNAPYNAASTLGSRGSAWAVSGYGPNAALTWNRTTLVNRSRDAARQNPLADATLNTYESNIVATGIKPLWQTGDSGFDKALRELWDEWTQEADADGRLGYYGMQSLSTRSMAEGGEVFLRFRNRRPGDMETVPLQIQMLESEFCPHDSYDGIAMQPNERAVNGVIFNRLDQRVAYLMYRQHPNDWSVLGATSDLIPVRVPAESIIHMARLRRPGEVRGEPWLTRGLITMRDHYTYNDAQLVRQQVSALIAGFITTAESDDEAYSDADGQAKRDSQSDSLAYVNWEPGSMSKLRTGEQIEFSKVEEVSSAFEPFMREQKRQIAVSAGVLYEQISGDYSQLNDRTFRAAINEFRRQVRAWQDNVVIFQQCRAVARRWTALGQLSGHIQVPRSVDERSLHRIIWMPRGWDYIHPVQEVQADILKIRAGLADRSGVAAERGRVAEDIDNQQAADNARADEKGLAYESDARVARAGGGAVNDPDAATEEGVSKEGAAA